MRHFSTIYWQEKRSKKKTGRPRCRDNPRTQAEKWFFKRQAYAPPIPPPLYVHGNFFAFFLTGSERDGVSTKSEYTEQKGECKSRGKVNRRPHFHMCYRLVLSKLTFFIQKILVASLRSSESWTASTGPNFYGRNVFGRS